jgi:hypothetical protein
VDCLGGAILSNALTAVCICGYLGFMLPLPVKGHLFDITMVRCLWILGVTVLNIVMYRPIGRQRLGRHIPVEANAGDNRTSIARQWISKHASLTIEAVFSVWPMQSVYKEGFG